MRRPALRLRLPRAPRLRDLGMVVKFGMAPTVALLVVMAVAGLSAAGLAVAQRTTEQIVRDDLHEVALLGAISADFERADADLYRLMADKAADPASVQVASRAAVIGRQLRAVAGEVDAYRRTPAGRNDAARVAVVRADVQRYAEAVDVVTSMLDVNFASSVAMLEPFRSNAQAVLGRVHEMSRAGVAAADRAAENGRRLSRMMTSALVVLFICGSVFATLLTVIIGTLTVRSIREIAEATSRLAGADYTQDLDVLHRSDELGAVVDALTVFRAQALRGERLARDLDAALSNMSHGLVMLDSAGLLILRNRRFTELFGLEEMENGVHVERMIEAIAYSPRSQFTAVERAAFVREHSFSNVRAQGGDVTWELASDFIVQMIYRRMDDGGWVATFDDITARRRSESKIAHMAMHDGLTGLPNRALFHKRLQAELSDREGAKVAAIAIDLDRFKEVNDTLGHAAGDRVLRVLAERMISILGDGELLARFGGDEFAGIKRFEDETELTGFLARLEAVIHQPIDLGEVEVSPGASIGVACFPNDAANGEALLNNADLAMYRAKTSVAERVCFYEAQMDEAARTRRALTQDLREAVKRRQLRVYYQVQRSLRTGEVVGHEALVRWVHPARGFIPPDEFIPLAESCGAILDIGEFVLREACREAASWADPVKLAVNLSAVQFSHPDLAGLVRDVLFDTGLSPERLELEITETAIIGDQARALHILRGIKAMGVTIAIDDFGTGYSSLGTLSAFPFDKIKIDKSFLRDSHISHQSRAVIRAILALGRSLKVPVLAEGVETVSDLELLRAEDCDEGQGYLFGRPEPQPVTDAAGLGGYGAGASA